MVIVEDEGFVELVRFITEDICRVKLELPKRTQLRHKIVVLASDLRRRVQADIADGCMYFSITTDIWTARNARSYISLTMHYVDDDFHLKNWTLEVRELPGIHDGQAIADALAQMMEDWSLPKDFCTRILSDSASNVMKAAKKLGIEHMSCIAHTLHLIVSGAMVKAKARPTSDEFYRWAEGVESEISGAVPECEDDELLSNDDRTRMDGLREFAIDDINVYLDATISSLQRSELDVVREIVQHFRTLAVYFRKSPKANHRLGAIQVRDYHVQPQEAVNLQVDCPTRWSSCWVMLQRLIYVESALVSFFTHIKSADGRKEFKNMASKLRRPKSADWLAIKCLCTLLDPFAKATSQLGGQTYPTIPLVLPAISGIRSWLSQEDLFASHAAAAGDESYVEEALFMMGECRRIMLDLFNDRFSELEKSELNWIAFLDPRVARRMPHLSPIAIPVASNNLVRATVDLAAKERNTPFQPSASAPHRRTPVAASNCVDTFNMSDYMFGPDNVEDESSDLERDCSEEVKLYLIDVKKSAGSKTNPLEWWRVHKTAYPTLCKLARKWLGAVATSVPSERAFSTSGNVVTVKRGSLTPEMVRNLVFVSENWRRYSEHKELC